MTDAALRAFVRRRACCRCEYCHLHEDEDDLFPFHVEHVIARQHGGLDDPDMLCWACSHCNWSKGPNVAGLLGGKLFPLFNPFPLIDQSTHVESNKVADGAGLLPNRAAGTQRLV